MGVHRSSPVPAAGRAGRVALGVTGGLARGVPGGVARAVAVAEPFAVDAAGVPLTARDRPLDSGWARSPA
jgi:hypothetical protein